MMNVSERALSFTCEGDRLPAILSCAAQPGDMGVVIVVGGPQYRIGSHRQFVLLARALAAGGFPCLRFDTRGMGDGEGAERNFESIDTDIGCAIDALQAAQPEVRRVVLWGLCDGAAAAAFRAATDRRITGLVLLNPWIRTPQSESAALVSDYYRKRLLSLEFWRKVLGGSVNVSARVREFLGHLGASRQTAPEVVPTAMQDLPLPQRWEHAMRDYGRAVLLILSGNDLTATEFRTAAAGPALANALGACTLSRVEVDDANHTFSSARWRGEVVEATLNWLRLQSNADKSATA